MEDKDYLDYRLVSYSASSGGPYVKVREEIICCYPSTYSWPVLFTVSYEVSLLSVRVTVSTRDNNQKLVDNGQIISEKIFTSPSLFEAGAEAMDFMNHCTLYEKNEEIKNG